MNFKTQKDKQYTENTPISPEYIRQILFLQSGRRTNKTKNGDTKEIF